MEFRNVYAQGFARVAACTLPVALADPAENARRIVEQVRAHHDDGVAVALFPELSLSGYAIDDLLLQDVLLDAVEAGIVAVAEATAGLTPLVVVGAPCATGTASTTAPSSSTAARSSASRPSRTCPTTASSTRSAGSPPAPARRASSSSAPRGPAATPTARSRSGPTCCFSADDVPGLVVHAEVCEDMWVPVPPSHEAALAGASVLLNLSASPITVGRAQDRHLLARSASARCNAAYLYAAASQGESSTDLSWTG